MSPENRLVAAEHILNKLIDIDDIGNLCDVGGDLTKLIETARILLKRPRRDPPETPR